MSIFVHLLRHGRVDSHRGDVPLSADARPEIQAAADRLAGMISTNQRVAFLTTATRRTRETAEGIRELLEANAGVSVGRVSDEPAIRNPDVWLAGVRVEMVSSLEAYAAQVPGGTVGPEHVGRIPFFRDFVESKDRIGFWLFHASPPGEDAEAVARRIMAFCASFADDPANDGARFVCVTHSPVLRAFLQAFLLNGDPGEPDFVESVDMTIEDKRLLVSFRGETRTTAR